MNERRSQVPSLPEPAYSLMYSNTTEAFTADQMNTRWLEGYEAGRAAGRASAEPEGFVLVPREPTREMLVAARDWSITKLGKAVGNDGASGCYAAMIAAAPTPTASIAPKAEEIAERFAGLDADMDALDAALATPKAEGEAELARGEVPSFESWWETWPFQAYKNELTKAAAHHAYRAGKSIGEGLTDCPNCLGDGKDGDVDDYGRMVGFDCHECNGTGKVRRAAPVTQAAAGDERIAHLLDYLDWRARQADRETRPTLEGYAAAVRALSPPPEADADRASGGGVPEWYGVQDEVALTRAVHVMNDVLGDISRWEDTALADAVKDSKIDLMAMIECIRMHADDTYVPGSKQIDGETFGATPTTKD